MQYASLNSERSTYLVSQHSELDFAADAFLKKFPNGGVFTIEGQMGAGKTTFVSALCRKLNLKFQGSPTFSIVHEYSLENDKTLYHFDLYRLKSTNEALDIGFDEYLYRGEYIFIEWPEMVQTLLPPDTHQITIIDDGGVRSLTF